MFLFTILMVKGIGVEVGITPRAGDGTEDGMERLSKEASSHVMTSGQASLNFLRINGERFVIKTFSSQRDYENEVSVIERLLNRTPFVMQPICVAMERKEIVYREACGGDLLFYELKRHTYDELVEISRQIVLAVAAVHRVGYLHMDIKPENIVLDKGQIFLIDFGLSQPIERGLRNIGTPRTMAPEILLPSAATLPVTMASDWWSVGVTIYYIFAKFMSLAKGAHYGYFPYQVLYADKDGQKAVKLQWPSIPPYSFPRPLFDLLFGYTGLLTYSPASRPCCAQQILSHPFFL